MWRLNNHCVKLIYDYKLLFAYDSSNPTYTEIDMWVIGYFSDDPKNVSWL